MRLRGIGPEVLLLCFLLVGAAAFVLGRRTSRGRRLRRDLDYFTGLDHLVNDRYDRATEVFTRLATKSHEADIQFALGSLMRKRGEVDRAIAIHTELEGNRETAIREQATYALGLDYMSAGLLDRAEEKLRNLMGSPRYRAAVLEREDLTPQWAGILVGRLAMYRSLRETTMARFGAEHFRKWDDTYAFFVDLFARRELAGGRLVARRDV